MIMGIIRVDFVTHDDIVSATIRSRDGVSMPFTPSHAEILSEDGKTYIGAYGFGGVMERPIDYESSYKPYILPSGKPARITVPLPATDEQTTEFYKFARSKIGEPYDWLAIFGEALTDVHLHTLDHVYCSAFVTMCLRHVNWFRWPLTKPFHKIPPDELFFALSSHVEILH
jgi:hypothetical protein